MWSKMNNLLPVAICLYSRRKYTTRVTLGHTPSHINKTTYKLLHAYKSITKTLQLKILISKIQKFLQISVNYLSRCLLYTSCILIVCKICKRKSTAATLKINSPSLSSELHTSSSIMWRSSPSETQVWDMHRRAKICSNQNLVRIFPEKQLTC